MLAKFAPPMGEHRLQSQGLANGSGAVIATAGKTFL